jgi:hypothetical protein
MANILNYDYSSIYQNGAGDWYRICQRCGKHTCYTKQCYARSALRKSKGGCPKCSASIRKMKHNVFLDSNGKWSRLCPSCNKVLTYSGKFKLVRAMSLNCVCCKCNITRRRARSEPKEIKVKANVEPKETIYRFGPFIRKCPKCQEDIIYSNSATLECAIRKNGICLKCFRGRPKKEVQALPPVELISTPIPDTKEKNMVILNSYLLSGKMKGNSIVEIPFVEMGIRCNHCLFTFKRKYPKDFFSIRCPKCGKSIDLTK